eukprot:7248850-Ditylum_brightwellii.AAC.1
MVIMSGKGVKVTSTPTRLTREQLEANIQVMQEKIAQLTSRHDMLQRETVPIFRLYSIKDKLALDPKLAQTTVIGLLYRRIFKDVLQDKELINFWSGTDPDSNIDCFPW